MYKSSKLFTPATVYLVVSILFIALAFLRGINVMLLFIAFVFVLVWTFWLNISCKNGFKSWVFVILPWLVTAVAYFVARMMNVYEGADSPDLSDYFYDATMGSNPEPKPEWVSSNYPNPVGDQINCAIPQSDSFNSNKCKQFKNDQKLKTRPIWVSENYPLQTQKTIK